MSHLNLFESSSYFFQHQEIDNSITNEIIKLSNSPNFSSASMQNGSNWIEESCRRRKENNDLFDNKFEENRVHYVRKNERSKTDHAMEIELCLVKCPRCHRISEKTQLQKRNKLCHNKSSNNTFLPKRQIELLKLESELAHCQVDNAKLAGIDIAENADRAQNALATRQNNESEKIYECQCETDEIRTDMTKNYNKRELWEYLRTEHRPHENDLLPLAEELLTDKLLTRKVHEREESSNALSLTNNLPFYTDFDAHGNVVFTEKINSASKENTVVSLWLESLVERATKEHNTLLQEQQNILRAFYCEQEILRRHNKKIIKKIFVTSDITEKNRANAFTTKSLDESDNNRWRSPSPLPLPPSPPYKHYSHETCENTWQTDVNCNTESSAFIIEDKCAESTSNRNNFADHNGSESEHSPANRQCTIPPPEQAYNSSNNTYLTNTATNKCENELHCFSSNNIESKERNTNASNARYRKEPFVSCGLSSYVYTSPSVNSVESIPGVTQSVELSTNIGLENEPKTNFQIAKKRIDRFTKVITYNQLEDNISQNKLFCADESVCLCNNCGKRIFIKENCSESEGVINTNQGNSQDQYCFVNHSDYENRKTNSNNHDNNNNNGSNSNTTKYINNNNNNTSCDEEEEEKSKSCYTVAKKMHFSEKEQIYQSDVNLLNEYISKQEINKETNQKFWTCASMPVYSQSNEQSVFSLASSVAMSAAAVKIASELSQASKEVNLQSREEEQESTLYKPAKMVTTTSSESFSMLPALTQESQSTADSELKVNICSSSSFEHPNKNYSDKVQVVNGKELINNSFGSNNDHYNSLLSSSFPKILEQQRLNDLCNAMPYVTKDNLVNSISSLRKLRHLNEMEEDKDNMSRH